MIRLEEVSLQRGASYSDNAGKLFGHVRFRSEDGEQTVNLSPGNIAALISILETSICKRAKRIAEQAPEAFENTSAELMIEDKETGLLEEPKNE